jgi:hypothetical protein
MERVNALSTKCGLSRITENEFYLQMLVMQPDCGIRELLAYRKI